MRFTAVLRVYTSRLLENQLKATAYHNRGKPRRVLRDDGTDYFSEPNLTPSEQDYRDRIKRLDELERMQGVHAKPCQSTSSAKKRPPHRPKK